MIKIFNTYLEKININSVKIIDNNLYLLYHKVIENCFKLSESALSELHLLTINLVTKNTKNKHIISDVDDFVKVSKIINNYIYIHDGGYVSVYDLNLKLIKKNYNVVENIFEIYCR